MRTFRPVVAGFVILAGCLAPHEAPQDTATDSPTVEGTSRPDLLPINFMTTYVVVKTQRTSGSVLVQENPTDPTRRDTELFLRVFDGHGQPHDRVFAIPTKGPGAFTRFEFAYPDVAPYLVTAECGCPFAWMENPDLDPDIEWMNGRFVNSTETHILLTYDATDLDDVRSKPAASDEKTYQANVSVLHWRMGWDFNLRGDTSLFTPSGRELAKWETEGRSAYGGHVSNGSTPLETGTWHLQLSGAGWFEFVLRQAWLEPSAWESYGIVPPNEVEGGTQNADGGGS